jgi:hypothetical protein
MSRRHRGRSHQHDRPRPDGTSASPARQPRAVDVGQSQAAEPTRSPDPTQAADAAPTPDVAPMPPAVPPPAPASRPPVQDSPSPVATDGAAHPAPGANGQEAPASNRPNGQVGPNGHNGQGRPMPLLPIPVNQATAPQLRRFIKSRPYVPMHELRRRFAIDGGDDDVTAVHIDRHWIFVGLPEREGGLLGELLRAGEIGYELSLDPRTPIVVGVYPMRPAPRP